MFGGVVVFVIVAGCLVWSVLVRDVYVWFDCDMYLYFVVIGDFGVLVEDDEFVDECE